MSHYNAQHKNLVVGADGGTAVAQGARLRCPKQLPKEAKAVWRRIVPHLTAAGILAEVDVVQLANLCFDQAMLERLQKDFWEEGPWTRTKTGRLVKSPLSTLVHEQAIRVNRLCNEFGLTVRARAILGDSLRNGNTEQNQPTPESDGVERLNPRLRSVA